MWRRKSINRYTKSIVNTIALGFCILVTTIILIGCSSMPNVPIRGSWFYSLPPGQDIYGKAKAHKIAPLLGSISLDGIPGDTGLSDFLTMTEEVYFSADTEMNHFSFIAVGEYPVVLLRSVIANSVGWRKGRGEIEHWVKDGESHSKTVQLAFPAYNVVCVSRGMIGEITLARLKEKQVNPPEGAEYPKAFLFDHLLADFSILLSDPQRSVGKGLPIDQERFPVQSAWFTASVEGEEYVSSFVFLPKDPAKAKTLATFMKLMLAGWMRKEGIGDVSTLSKTARLEVKDDRVAIEGIRFSSEDVLKLLTLYGSGTTPY